MSKRITDCSLNIVKKAMINGAILKDACLLINYHPDVISKKLRDENFSTLNFNNKTTDINYFENIDSEYKAYFLGFLLADGNISTTTNRVCFTINSDDDYILDIFKKDIKSNNNIRRYLVFDKRTGKFNKSSVFQISSKKIKDDLHLLGISSDKSNYFDYTKIVCNNYFNHFLRGLFDGDGYISKDKARIGIISTKEFLDYINTNILTKAYPILNIAKNVNTIRIQNKRECINFLDFIYSNSTIFLYRKYKLYNKLKLIKIYNSSRVKPCVVTLPTKELLHFNSVKDVANYFNVNPSTLVKHLQYNNIYKECIISRSKYKQVKKEIL